MNKPLIAVYITTLVKFHTVNSKSLISAQNKCTFTSAPSIKFVNTCGEMILSKRFKQLCIGIRKISKEIRLSLMSINMDREMEMFMKRSYTPMSLKSKYSSIGPNTIILIKWTLSSRIILSARLLILGLNYYQLPFLCPKGIHLRLI